MNVVEKFDKMLKTKKIYYFDVDEFEDITAHYFDQGDYVTALTVLKYGLIQHPENQQLMLFKINILLIQGHYDKAEKVTKELISIDPLDEDRLLLLASIYSYKDQTEKCIETLTPLLESDNSMIREQATQSVGLEYFGANQYDKAHEYLMDSLNLIPYDKEILEKYVHCHQIIGKKVDAIPELVKFLESHPGQAHAWRSLSELFCLAKEFDLAQQSIDNAIDLKPKNSKSHQLKGDVYYKSKDYTNAVKYYKKALELGGKFNSINSKIGCCYQRLSQNWLAHKHFSLPIQSGSQNSSCWKNLLKFLINEGLYDRAQHYIEQYFDFKSESSGVWKQCTKVYEHYKLIEQLDFCIDNYLIFGNPKVSHWMYCAKIWIHLSQWNKALQILFEANELFGRKRELDELIKICMDQYNKNSPLDKK